MMKKYISVFVVLFLVAIGTLPVSATVSQSNLREQVLAPIRLYQKGDLDGDGMITAADARLCLRAAAGLEQLNEQQLQAADLSGNGTLVSSSARFILRTSVGLEQINSAIVRSETNALIVGPFVVTDSDRYMWKCSVSPLESFLCEISELDKDGSSGLQKFHINLKTYGTFTFVFKLICSETGEELKQYILTVQRSKLEDFPVIVENILN